jgi:hypothetical protein
MKTQASKKRTPQSQTTGFRFPSEKELLEFKADAKSHKMSLGKFTHSLWKKTIKRKEVIEIEKIYPSIDFIKNFIEKIYFENRKQGVNVNKLLLELRNKNVLSEESRQKFIQIFNNYKNTSNTLNQIIEKSNNNFKNKIV